MIKYIYITLESVKRNPVGKMRHPSTYIAIEGKYVTIEE